jgi:hypothetical protein
MAGHGVGGAIVTTATATRTTVNLEAICHDQACADLAFQFRNQLGTPNYSDGISLLELPDSVQEWRDQHRTARKRADRAERLGYRFEEIDRSQYADDIFDIHTSLPERQGRPMDASYQIRRSYSPLPDYPCDRHRVHTYGILKRDRLRAYLALYRVGELALISQILGHGDHLRADIMYLLALGLIREQIPQGGWFYYNRHDSGTEGLVYYKERLGFRAGNIQWNL